MQHQSILRVLLFLLFLAVTTTIAKEDGGDSRREMTTDDWSGTTQTSVTTDGHQLIVSREEEMEDGRSGRAAEIQATNLNLGNPSELSSTTTTTTAVPISSSTTDEPDFSLDGHETSTSGPTSSESSTESLSFTSPSATDLISTTTTANNSSTTTLKMEEEEIHHIATTPTPAKETTLTTSNMNGDEYVADDHGPSLTTDNDGLLDSAEPSSIVVNHKHTEPVLPSTVADVPPTTSEKTATAISTTTTEATTTPAATIKPLNHLMTAAAAVGRSLAQEENVAWPESKSTKVIGTIIEDIHSPSSSSSTAESITNGSIVAIALCTVCLIVSSLGASGYWWYRRRYLTNRPETLSDRYAPSETGGAGGGEDIFRVGYIHSPEMPRDSSEEMYSLDNDSFLTSLEAMTIPTYWTESIKHTKL